MQTIKLFRLVLILAVLGAGCQRATETAGPATARSDTPAPNSSGCTDSASFVADVTVPDGQHFDKGEAFTKTWRIKNTGTCTWTDDYTLVFATGEQIDAGESIPLSQTKPNAEVDISVELEAPSSDGAFTSNFEVRNGRGEGIKVDDGQYLWVKITTGNVTSPPTAEPFSETASCSYTQNAEFLTQMLVLINGARTTAGLPAVSLNAQLSAAAQAHSADMACNSLLSHTGSKGSTLRSRLAAEGYASTFQIENIYAQPPNFGGNPQAAMDWWLADAVHRDAILDSRVTEVGLGYAFVQDSELGGYFTVDLAAP